MLTTTPHSTCHLTPSSIRVYASSTSFTLTARPRRFVSIRLRDGNGGQVIRSESEIPAAINASYLVVWPAAKAAASILGPARTSADASEVKWLTGLLNFALAVNPFLTVYITTLYNSCSTHVSLPRKKHHPPSAPLKHSNYTKGYRKPGTIYSVSRNLYCRWFYQVIP